ncbi:MAG: molecular chaperone HtpG [Bacteroidetes bacterium GWC2_33_15]|nr:MAG: molecular chaperone HtpG [Bacteroidetes bacterium GWA2_33_15]OFX51085.1 MAG: molecular chaperone HtpG [Bacteroidetes bacterium GWC2_33_15]OFX66482.1 MAG: molecular chaperone HtpG [Bacteroidetes bacterium GWB2_32_14]OFX70293.1 MAG: molecular chaperone HtpG [Bacteroidetes bacterium GWD2_33_33]HAN17290.1 molecular chaperone HtpG [Bacteroidales bacterium]
MQTGKIGVTTENIFPIIKKFLYSDHEIFLRELVSNAIDATQKLKKLSSMGEIKGDLGDLTIRVSLDKKKKTLTVSDRGIGMTNEEVEKYINQIAFSSAGEFLNKFKDQTAIIGKFGLGFYSSFMVSKKVEIITKSYKDDAKAVKWECDGSPEYSIEEVEKNERGTDIILHIDDESKEFAEESKIKDLLNKYCRFLPVEIAFGKEKDWKDGKEVETDKDHIINDTNPLWTRKPADLKDEDYKLFYDKLYPFKEEPLFHIHLNVDYPFNLTGILYFPKIKNNIEVQKNKIQLYANQVFVTDSVEGIVPEFLTLLHGVLDSPDIPLNVSRSYLQSDSNVKKISSHITKKVGDRLEDIFKNDRSQFEQKWDDLKVFIEYGMLTDEKFYDKAKDFTLLKNTDSKYFTFEEYEKLIKENQTDKNKTLVYLYATDKDQQFTFIENAKQKGYDVLLMDGQLDTHFINQLEQKFKDSRFMRVDSDVVDKLIKKDDIEESSLSSEEKDQLTAMFESQLPKNNTFIVSFENMKENDDPIVITQSEFMRRMKDMAAMSGGMNFYGNLPDSFNLVINSNHKLLAKISEQKDKKIGTKISKLLDELKPVEEEKEKLNNSQKDKKEEEINQSEKDKLSDVEKNIETLKKQKKELLETYGKENKLVKQLIDLALLANNMLKGEDLTKFVKRSVELIK